MLIHVLYTNDRERSITMASAIGDRIYDMMLAAIKNFEALFSYFSYGGWCDIRVMLIISIIIVIISIIFNHISVLFWSLLTVTFAIGLVPRLFLLKLYFLERNFYISIFISPMNMSNPFEVTTIQWVEVIDFYRRKIFQGSNCGCHKSLNANNSSIIPEWWCLISWVYWYMYTYKEDIYSCEDEGSNIVRFSKSTDT